VTQGLRGLRVLLVEDEAIVSMLIEEYLEELGCTLAGVASRLKQALALADSLPLDAAVLDVNLAGELSYPVAELLRLRNVPFVFVSGYGVTGLPETLRTSPALAKPFRPMQLAQALQAARGG
jgi:CheY-like chemotaxis protein